MNRRQVAQRLGKSLATVRRLEGVLLHPTRDGRGIHRFDDQEVEALARGVEDGAVTLWQEMRRGSADAATDDQLADFGVVDGCASCVELEKQLQALNDEVNELRRRRRVDSDELDKCRAEFAAERREFESQAAELLAAVESL